MKDTIYRQDAIDAFCEQCTLKGKDICPDPCTELRTIYNLPSAEPEITRCKDCIWKQGSECVRFADVRPFADDFCSRAERRIGGK